jgi:NAD(P)-dependent dehydrogenase (short-subunit alcohol dehydrogenase family)
MLPVLWVVSGPAAVGEPHGRIGTKAGLLESAVEPRRDPGPRLSDPRAGAARRERSRSARYGAGMTAKRAIITGCSTGIGRATAIELTDRGYEVIATARRLDALDDLEVFRTLALDVDDDASVAAALAAAGPIDVLVNNAGFGVEGAVETVPLEDVRRMFETNFFGAARMIQAFVPDMRVRGGAVVNVTSTAGIAAPPLGGYYSASKFALEALSEALHLEVGHFGVRVLVIEPGAIETRFAANVVDHRGEPGPYEELADLWQGAQDKLGGGQPAPGPELVASVIADALEADHHHLRWPVGSDAELIAAARQGTSYDDFAAGMRDVLALDW